MIGALDTHRPLWVASFEAVALADHVPELREALAAGFELARLGLAELLQKIDESTVGERTLTKLGSLHLALLDGLMLQWLIDPDRAPTGRDMVEALRVLLGSLQPAGT